MKNKILTLTMLVVACSVNARNVIITSFVPKSAMISENALIASAETLLAPAFMSILPQGAFGIRLTFLVVIKITFVYLLEY